MQDVEFVAIGDLNLSLQAVEELFALVAHELVVGLPRRRDSDDEGVHMTRGASRCEAEVRQVAGVTGGLEALEARDLLHLPLLYVVGPRRLVVIHEGAETDAQGTGDLNQRREGGGQISLFEPLDDFDVRSRALGELLLGQMMGLAQRHELASESVVLFCHVRNSFALITQSVLIIKAPSRSFVDLPGVYAQRRGSVDL